MTLAVLGVAGALVPLMADAGTTAPLGSPQSTATSDDTDSVELGAQFTVGSATTATGVRFYKGLGNVGPHTGTLWDSDGDVLATTTFKNETATGWQQAKLDTAVALTPGTTYTVSYFAPQGRYTDDEDAFSNGTVLTSGPARQTAGVYAYGDDSSFPTDTWHDSNYFVDVVTATSSTPTPPPAAPTPTPSPTTPAPTPTTSTPAPTPTTSTPVPTPTTSTPTPTPTPTTGSSGSSAWPASPPDAGTPAGTTLTKMAGLTITTPGTVLEDKLITGTVTVAADNVVIRDSRITGSGSFGVLVQPGASAEIDNTTVTGFDNGVGGDNYVANFVEVTGLLADGFKLGTNVVVSNSWCHDLTPAGGAHADCGQLQAGETNVVVKHNWFDVGTGDGNSALFLAPDLGPSSAGPLTVSDNVLGGGNYSLFCVDGNDGEYYIANITIQGNYFLDNARYGPDSVNVPVKWLSNTWLDTGKLISL